MKYKCFFTKLFYHTVDLKELHPNLLKGEQKDSYHYYRVGLEYFESGELESALENFLRSSESEPHFKTCERTAHILRELKRFEEADRFLEQAYRLNPKNDKTGIEYSR
ncbi:hypothetical protein QUF80_07630 [Desulfococcaceae bacterium HSG8]|nr:hypothetical protein [Desulfococcaceae bacterium HSG8]